MLDKIQKAETAINHDLKRRRGVVKIEFRLLDSYNNEFLHLLFSRFYPLRCEADYYSGEVMYAGVSNEFDIIDEGCIVPIYNVVIGENEDLSMSLIFKKQNL